MLYIYSSLSTYHQAAVGVLLSPYHAALSFIVHLQLSDREQTHDSSPVQSKVAFN
jgi:hypothetical protein